MKIRTNDLTPLKKATDEVVGMPEPKDIEITKEAIEELKKDEKEKEKPNKIPVIEPPTDHVTDKGCPYSDRIFEYLKTTDYVVAHDIRDAIERRKNGEKVLSLRELDILARGNIKLNGSCLMDSVLMDTDSSFMLCEGTPGSVYSGWHLRYRYNKGIEWIADATKRMDSASNKGLTRESARIAGTIEKAKGRIGEIKAALSELHIPPWPEEANYGFAPFLLKPEFMSAREYASIAGKKVEINAAELNNMVEMLACKS